MWSRRTFRESGKPQAPCCKLVSPFYFAWVLLLSPIEVDQIMYAYTDTKPATPWNKGRIIGHERLVILREYNCQLGVTKATRGKWWW